MSDWYCRYCSYYTNSNRCTCDDPPEELPKRMQKRIKNAKLHSLKAEAKRIAEEIKKLEGK